MRSRRYATQLRAELFMPNGGVRQLYFKGDRLFRLCPTCDRELLFTGPAGWACTRPANAPTATR